MMKTVICLPEPGDMKNVYESIREIVKGQQRKSEVICCADPDIIRNHLNECACCYDILILDALNRECLKAAEQLRKKNLISSIIFVAKNAAKVGNLFIYRPSWLVTSLDDSRQLSEAFRFACKEQLRANPWFTVRNKEMIVRIHYEDIIWFESRQRIVILHGRKKEISFYAKLTEVQSLLPEEKFIRCHQSYIVNIHMIERVDKSARCFYTRTGDRIEISKSYYVAVMERLEKNDFQC